MGDEEKEKLLMFLLLNDIIAVSRRTKCRTHLRI
jgi:hypothetical protein